MKVAQLVFAKPTPDELSLQGLDVKEHLTFGLLCDSLSLRWALTSLAAS